MKFDFPSSPEPTPQIFTAKRLRKYTDARLRFPKTGSGKTRNWFAAKEYDVWKNGGEYNRGDMPEFLADAVEKGCLCVTTTEPEQIYKEIKDPRKLEAGDMIMGPDARG